MQNKLTACVDAISKVTKVGDLPVLEMDAAAQEVTEEFLRIWLVTRIRHNKALARDIKLDTVYSDVTSYVVNLNSAFFFPRMWSQAGIKDSIADPMATKQEILEFVYRGASTLHARIFGTRSNDQVNPSFQALTKHLVDSLCIMSSNDNLNLLDASHRSVFPAYAATLELFDKNPWLVFIYYLCRVDIYEMISVAKGASK